MWRANSLRMAQPRSRAARVGIGQQDLGRHAHERRLPAALYHRRYQHLSLSLVVRAVRVLRKEASTVAAFTKPYPRM